MIVFYSVFLMDLKSVFGRSDNESNDAPFTFCPFLVTLNAFTLWTLKSKCNIALFTKLCATVNCFAVSFLVAVKSHTHYIRIFYCRRTNKNKKIVVKKDEYRKKGKAI